MLKESKKDLTVYISKLNDRNLSRQSATGFTLWALIGAFVYLLAIIINNFVQILNSNDTTLWFLPILGIVIGAGYFLVLGTLSILNWLSPEKVLRTVRPRLDTFAHSIIVIPINILYLLYAILYFYLALNASIYNLSFFACILLGMFFIHNPIYIIYKKIKELIDKVRKGYLYREVGNMLIEVNVLTSIILLLITIAGLFLLFLNYKDMTLTLKVNQIKLLLMTSLELFGLNILVIILFNRYSQLRKYDWLENLEKDIYLKDLSNEEIIEKLESHFLWISPKAWIEKKRSQLLGLYKEWLEYLCEKEKELEDVYSLHEEKEEIYARAMKAYEELGKGFDSYNNRIRDILNNVKLFLSKFMSGEEKEEMKLLVNEVANLSEQIRKKAEPLRAKHKQLKRYKKGSHLAT